MTTNNGFHQTLRLISQGSNDPALVTEAWAHWAAIEPDDRLHLVAADGRDGERARVWSLGWDGGMETILYHVEDQERQIAALEAQLSAVQAQLGAFITALTDHDDPSLWRIQYLRQIFRDYQAIYDQDLDDDPDATAEAIDIIGRCLEELRLALAAATPGADAIDTDVEVQ